MDKPADYLERAARLLVQGESTGQKTVLFGPELSGDLNALRPAAAVVADPYVAFLNKGALEPEAIFAAFREQTAAARAQGFSSLRVVADMDWLLPAHPDIDAIVGFELLLDRLVGEIAGDRDLRVPALRPLTPTRSSQRWPCIRSPRATRKRRSSA